MHGITLGKVIKAIAMDSKKNTCFRAQCIWPVNTVIIMMGVMGEGGDTKVGPKFYYQKDSSAKNNIIFSLSLLING